MKDSGKNGFEWLTEAISPKEPCGPNLETVDDPDFIDYYFDAETRLPDRYFTPGLKTEGGEGTDDKLFDPKTVDLKKERKTIFGLLERSRDLRLLSLLARFSILAGRITDFADAIEGIAQLLETFSDDVHPVIGKTVSNRRMPLDDLGSPSTVTIPLQYFPLNGQPDVTFRRYLVATGKTEPRSGENDVTVTQITDAIADPGAKEHVEKVYDALNRALQGFERIKHVCVTHEETPFTPAFGDTPKVLSEIAAVIRQIHPKLIMEANLGETADTKEPEARKNKTEEPQTALAHSKETETLVANPAAAKVVLQAVEQYFAKCEPSSAAVLLVTQARLLIGRPLIEALETLLPEHSKNAVIDFGKETGFVLSIDRLRNLSSEMPAPVASSEQEENHPTPEINTRLEVSTHLRGVIEYYRQNEPTSPIPILLTRANEYLEKDFNAIVSELLPIQPIE